MANIDGALAAAAAAAGGYLGANALRKKVAVEVNAALPALGELPEAFAANMQTADWLRRDAKWRDYTHRLLEALGSLQATNSAAVAVRLYGGDDLAAETPSTRSIGWACKNGLLTSLINRSQQTDLYCLRIDRGGTETDYTNWRRLNAGEQCDVIPTTGVTLAFNRPLHPTLGPKYLLCGTASYYDFANNVRYSDVGLGDLMQRFTLGDYASLTFGAYKASGVFVAIQSAYVPHLGRTPQKPQTSYALNVIQRDVISIDVVQSAAPTFAKEIADSDPILDVFRFLASGAIITSMKLDAWAMVPAAARKAIYTVSSFSSATTATVDGVARVTLAAGSNAALTRLTKSDTATVGVLA